MTDKPAGVPANITEFNSIAGHVFAQLYDSLYFAARGSVHHKRDMTIDECKSPQIVAAAFANQPGQGCKPGSLALVGLVGDLFQ